VTYDFNVAYIDTVEGSTGLYYNTYTTGNVEPYQNIGGSPDGNYAELGGEHLGAGGFVLIDASGDGLSSITVHIKP